LALAASVGALVALLDELGRLIDRIDDAVYAAPAPGRSAGGGIGGHVRHSLDHVAAVIAATRTGVCQYDRRARGTDVETNRQTATAAIAALRADLACLAPAVLGAPVRVETQLDLSGEMCLTWSTIERELVFAASHTIHHNAILGLVLRAHAVPPPPRFGLAPATPTLHDIREASLPCAR
jgi:hypothetical protein